MRGGGRCFFGVCVDRSTVDVGADDEMRGASDFTVNTGQERVGERTESTLVTIASYTDS